MGHLNDLLAPVTSTTTFVITFCPISFRFWSLEALSTRPVTCQTTSRWNEVRGRGKVGVERGGADKPAKVGQREINQGIDGGVEKLLKQG